MFGWDLNDILTFVTMFCVFIFMIFASRPNCRWIWKSDSEAQERARKLVQKAAIVGLLLGASFMVLSMLINYLGQLK